MLRKNKTLTQDQDQTSPGFYVFIIFLMFRGDLTYFLVKQSSKERIKIFIMKKYSIFKIQYFI